MSVTRLVAQTRHSVTAESTFFDFFAASSATGHHPAALSLSLGSFFHSEQRVVGIFERT